MSLLMITWLEHLSYFVLNLCALTGLCLGKGSYLIMKAEQLNKDVIISPLFSSEPRSEYPQLQEKFRLMNVAIYCILKVKSLSFLFLTQKMR